MANRRLAPPEQQPDSFAFTKENLDWANVLIARYPEGRQQSAVIPLLWRAQEQHHGWLPQKAMEVVAGMLGMAYIRVMEVATFYTMFLLQPVGKKAHVQVWNDTYEDLTPESFNKVLDGFAEGNPPKPGPQVDRQFSAPVGGATTLKTVKA